MLKENVLDCSWEQFEELIKEAIGSDFIWKIRPRDTEANRQAVVESIERMVGEHKTSFPARRDIAKRKLIHCAKRAVK